MEKLDKIQEVKVGEQETEVDPRSKTDAAKAEEKQKIIGPYKYPTSGQMPISFLLFLCMDISK